MSDDVRSLADEKFVSMATWKKSGEKVARAMWLARDGDALVMWTPPTAGRSSAFGETAASNCRRADGPAQ